MEAQTSRTATRQQIAEREAELKEMTVEQLQALALEKWPGYQAKLAGRVELTQDILEAEFGSVDVTRYQME